MSKQIKRTRYQNLQEVGMTKIEELNDLYSMYLDDLKEVYDAMLEMEYDLDIKHLEEEEICFVDVLFQDNMELLFIKARRIDEVIRLQNGEEVSPGKAGAL